MLGESVAGKAAGLRNDIITVLANAINHESSQRKMMLCGDKESEDTSQGPGADTLYAELLQVAGWPI